MSENDHENQTPADVLSLSDIDIRRSIEYLSFFLSTLRPGGTRQRHGKNPIGTALTHFATLLSGKRRIVAVTGSLTVSGPDSSAVFNGTISIAENSLSANDMDVTQCSKLELHKVSARIQDSKGTRLEKKFEDTMNDMK
jgi:hypothetical protein